jgi:hypothetical protein
VNGEDSPILPCADGAGNHHSSDLAVPDNIIDNLLPPYSPELSPHLKKIYPTKCAKIFKNYASNPWKTSTPKVEEAALYIEGNPAIVNPTSLRDIVRYQSDRNRYSAPTAWARHGHDSSARAAFAHPAQARCLSAARSGRSKAKITAPAAIATAAIVRKNVGFVILSQKLPR